MVVPKGQGQALFGQQGTTTLSFPSDATAGVVLHFSQHCMLQGRPVFGWVLGTKSSGDRLRVPGLNQWHAQLESAGVATDPTHTLAEQPGTRAGAAKQRKQGRLQDEEVDEDLIGEDTDEGAVMTAAGRKVNKFVTFNLPAKAAVGSPLPEGAVCNIITLVYTAVGERHQSAP
jgi:hypothetical protein